MIFTKAQSARVAAGVQTRTTRPATFRAALGGVHPVLRGRYGKPIAWVRVVGIARVRLGSLSIEDIQAEGFHSLSAFKAHWRQVRGRWQADLEVVHLTIVLTDKPERHRLQTTLLFDSEEVPQCPTRS